MPEIWKQGVDCLFLDLDEATKEQLSFIGKVKKHFDLKTAGSNTETEPDTNLYEFRTHEEVVPYETELTVPKKFQHVDLEKVIAAQTKVDELLAVFKRFTPGRRCIMAFMLPMWSANSTWIGYRNIWSDMEIQSSPPRPGELWAPSV